MNKVVAQRRGEIFDSSVMDEDSQMGSESPHASRVSGMIGSSTGLLNEGNYSIPKQRGALKR